MEDHLDLLSIWEVIVPDEGVTVQNPYGSDQLIDEYRTNRTGPLTSPGVAYIGWEYLPEQYRSNLSASAIADLAKFPTDWPEVE
jgi:choline dehydrogenase